MTLPVRLLATFALVVVATGAGALLRSHLAAPDYVMLYMLVIAVAAARFGRGASLFAAAASVLAYDYFFVPPFHTFAVADERHLLTFAAMFALGVVISGVTDRLRANERERAKLAEVAAAADLRARTEQMRSSLLSAVSHDLRTPLGAITGAATTLRDGRVDIEPEQRAELIDTICQEAERLERFVGNLLEMTRLQAGAVEVKREWVPVEEVIGAALTRLDAQFQQRPTKIELAPGLPLVSVDPVLLGQVFYNLLENAVKHTPSGTEVRIRARTADGALVVEISDSGPGLPESGEAAIFEKFVRGKTTAPGAGLGLAICRGIVEAHGGTISAVNVPQGGAAFRIVLPLTGSPPTVPSEPDSSTRTAP